MKSKPAE
jgi:tubulin polyglutamylase TTLL6/13